MKGWRKWALLVLASVALNAAADSVGVTHWLVRIAVTWPFCALGVLWCVGLDKIERGRR